MFRGILASFRDWISLSVTVVIPRQESSLSVNMQVGRKILGAKIEIVNCLLVVCTRKWRFKIVFRKLNCSTAIKAATKLLKLLLNYWYRNKKRYSKTYRSEDVIKYRKGKLAKQNENYQKDWADVEWHKRRGKTINSTILSQKHKRASTPCRQNINFWLIRSHVSQSLEIT